MQSINQSFLLNVIYLYFHRTVQPKVKRRFENIVVTYYKKLYFIVRMTA